MKKLAMTLVAALFISNMAVAQEKKCGACKNNKAQQKTEMMAKKLNLTDEQKAKVFELNIKFDEKMKAAICEKEQAPSAQDCCKKEEPKAQGCCKEKAQVETAEKKSCCKEKAQPQQPKSCCKKDQTADAKQCSKKPDCGPKIKMCPKKMQQMRQEYMAELKTILTEEQMNQLKSTCPNCKKQNGGEQKCEK